MTVRISTSLLHRYRLAISCAKCQLMKLFVLNAMRGVSIGQPSLKRLRKSDTIKTFSQAKSSKSFQFGSKSPHDLRFDLRSEESFLVAFQTFFGALSKQRTHHHFQVAAAVGGIWVLGTVMVTKSTHHWWQFDWTIGVAKMVWTGSNHQNFDHFFFAWHFCSEYQADTCHSQSPGRITKLQHLTNTVVTPLTGGWIDYYSCGYGSTYCEPSNCCRTGMTWVILCWIQLDSRRFYPLALFHYHKLSNYCIHELKHHTQTSKAQPLQSFFFHRHPVGLRLPLALVAGVSWLRAGRSHPG